MQQKSFTYKFSCQIKVKVLWIIETNDLLFYQPIKFFFLTENKKYTYVPMYEIVRENAWFTESDQTLIFDNRKFT